MSQAELFTSCRVGDIERVQFLLEFKDVELNYRDRWDGTPLYYACLCGHEQLVQFLLSNGARCEANTFDGERCLYAALNDNIRGLLKGYKAVTSNCMRRDSFREFLRRCLEDGIFHDVVFNVHGTEYRVHRVILSARSEYFRNMLSGKWKGRGIIYLNHPTVTPHAFKALLQYLYTERLDVATDYVDDCICLARQCQLSDLRSRLEKQQMESLALAASKPGTGVSINIVSVEPDLDVSQMSLNFRLLASAIVGDKSSMCEDMSACPDICISIEDERYFCHKVFLCGRSEYFRALLTGHFSEAVCSLDSSPVDRHDTIIPEVTLHDIPPAVFSLVVEYIYSNQVDVSPEFVYPLLSAADMYLLPGLAKACSVAVAPHLNEHNVIDILTAARLFAIPRLEMQCAQVIAGQLEKIVETDDFSAIVKDEAETIREREGTDSIPLVDDIRFHIANLSVPEEAKEYKLALLDTILEKLGIEC